MQQGSWLRWGRTALGLQGRFQTAATPGLHRKITSILVIRKPHTPLWIPNQKQGWSDKTRRGVGHWRRGGTLSSPSASIRQAPGTAHRHCGASPALSEREVGGKRLTAQYEMGPSEILFFKSSSVKLRKSFLFCKKKTELLV